MAKILVIDDERAIRNTLKEILGDEGHTVDVAEDGKKGMEKARQNEYDLIFSDVKMPEIDGIELLTALKQPADENSYVDCPIVMISGHGDIETAVEALKKGAYDFIEKPLDLNRLLITIKNALEQKNLRVEVGRGKQEISSLRKKVAQQKNQMWERAVP